MKKLFLQDGKPHYGSPDNSVDISGEILFQNNGSWILDKIIMLPDKLYDLPKGWTVEIEDYRCPKCGYTHEDTIINGDHWMCTEKIPKRIKIARLVPDLSILESKASGIVATGVPDGISLPEAEHFTRADVKNLMDIASKAGYRQRMQEESVSPPPQESQEDINAISEALQLKKGNRTIHDIVCAAKYLHHRIAALEGENKDIQRMRSVLKKARKYVSEGSDMLYDTEATKIKSEFNQCVIEIDEVLTRKP